MTVRILVVDDHPVVRHGIRTLLGGRAEWEIVDEAEDGIEAVEKANRLKPDVVFSMSACREWTAWKLAGGYEEKYRNPKS